MEHGALSVDITQLARLLSDILEGYSDQTIGKDVVVALYNIILQQYGTERRHIGQSYSKMKPSRVF